MIVHLEIFDYDDYKIKRMVEIPMEDFKSCEVSAFV